MTGPKTIMTDHDATAMQTRCIETLAKHAANGYMTTTELAARLKTNNLAVHSAMSALERAGLAYRFRRGTDQWAPLCWGVKDETQS